MRMFLEIIFWTVICTAVMAVFNKLTEGSKEAKKNRERYERVCNYDKNIFVAQDQAEKRIKQDERLR